MNKERLLEWLKTHPAASFSEIESFFEDCGYNYKGEHRIEYFPESNVMIWSGWSLEATKMITDLSREERISLKTVPPIIWLTFGKLYDLPIAKRYNHKYKDLHWLPVVVSCNAS